MATISPHSQKARLSSVTQVRLHPFHHRYLVRRAELRGISISGFLREIVECEMLTAARALDTGEGGARAEVLRSWFEEHSNGIDLDGFAGFADRLAYEADRLQHDDV